MLCEKCGKNEATFYYHENVNGKEKTFRLCRECQEAMQKSGELKAMENNPFFEQMDSFFADPFPSMHSLLDGFFGKTEAPSHSLSNGEGKKCPGCGMTFRELAAEGMAGCAKCYETFAEELEPTVSRLRARNTAGHIGRIPARFREKLEGKRKIEALEAEQKEAVKNENYERAAELRDELKKLRGEQ